MCDHYFIAGKAGDSLSYHKGKEFSTKDRDNDNLPDVNCAQKYKGGGWYDTCFASNLNGPYQRGGKQTSSSTGIHWKAWKGFDYSAMKVVMKIRPEFQPRGK